MKCPKCSLVTFDYLSKCPRCDTSFKLSRRLTGRRANPERRILIAGESSPADPADAATETSARQPQTPPQDTPSLREMAETEQREDLAVNVAAAVAAARAGSRAPETQPAPPGTPPGPEPPLAPAGAAPSESRSIKERMMRASRARRKERPDLVTESTDPVLPDWYEPDADEPDGATSSRGNSTDRR